MRDEQSIEGFKRLGRPIKSGERLNARTALLGLFVVLTIALASTTVYESGIRTTLTSTSTSTSTAISVSITTTTETSVSTITTTSFVNPTKVIEDAYLSHIGAIVSQNATALAAQYETNATLLYTMSPNGNPPNGSFHGSANITRFYEGSAFLLSTYAVANETHSMTMSNDDKAGNVTSHLVFYGTNTHHHIPGQQGFAFAYVIGLDLSYVLQGGRWLISTESLTYINAFGCPTEVLSPDGSVLTCPNYSG
jgi:hypothetical protein